MPLTITFEPLDEALIENQIKDNTDTIINNQSTILANETALSNDHNTTDGYLATVLNNQVTIINNESTSQYSCFNDFDGIQF